MQFHTIVETSKSVASTRSRKQKVELLSSCLLQASSDERSLAVNYLGGQLPQGKIGVGVAAVRSTLSETPANSDALAISLVDVDAQLRKIAETKGTGSTARRRELLKDLFAKTTTDGQHFLGRLMLGEIRQGALEGVMIEAVAKSTGVSSADIRRATMLTGDLSLVAQRAATEGLAGVRGFSLQLFRPVQPMLAETAEDVVKALTQLESAALEHKLDGVRVQVHKDHDEVQVFTRHLKDVAANTPEIVEQVRQLSPRQIILDGEVLALRSDGRPHAFQTTMRRFGRKHDVDNIRKELPLSVSFFDCLFVDQQPLLDLTTQERHIALTDAVPSELGISRLETSNADEAQRFLRDALAVGHEGIMAKSMDAVYAAGGRGQSWLKIKPAHTLDLVVLAAEWGSGRRRGWLSNLHLGVLDPSSGSFAMIGKTFKGLTDELLIWQTQQLLSIQESSDGHIVYVKPQLVVEIAFSEVQQSPHYPSGFALRFARVKRYRSDKLPGDADTIDTIAKLFVSHRR